MRLIDADRLKEKMLEWLPSDPCGIGEKERPIETDIVVSLMMEIEDAPTVSAEPKTGKWIDDGCIEKCSQCGERREFPHWNYCPNCGARMRGDKDDKR